jgi:hypothetical protein
MPVRLPNEKRISCGRSCPRPDQTYASLAALEESAARPVPHASPARRPHVRVRRRSARVVLSRYGARSFTICTT